MARIPGLLAALASLAVCVQTAAAETFVVEMTTVDGDPRFVPASIVIEPGDTIRWINTDLYHEHSVCSGAGSADPSSGTEFVSGLLRLGEYFEHTFFESGEFDYYSIPHEYAGMFGTVRVGSSTDVPELRESTWGLIKRGFSDLLPRD